MGQTPVSALDCRRQARIVTSMKARPSQPIKKRVTLDTLAAAIQQDFSAIHGDLATVKEDLKSLKIGVKNVKEDVTNIKDIMVSKVDVQRAIREELSKSQEAKDIESLRERVTRVEEELGLKRPMF